MQLYKVPAVSIAVIENFKIAWAKAYGVTLKPDNQNGIDLLKKLQPQKP
jgi:hypothetical protein